MGVEDGGVEIALRGGEARGGREGAGNVGDVVAVLGASVNKEKGGGGNLGVVAGVMDLEGVLVVRC